MQQQKKEPWFPSADKGTLAYVGIASLLPLSMRNALFACSFFAGSPFSCVVDSVNGGFVTAFGVGLVGGSSGEEETFTVVAKQGTASEPPFLLFLLLLRPLLLCRLICRLFLLFCCC